MSGWLWAAIGLAIWLALDVVLVMIAYGISMLNSEGEPKSEAGFGFVEHAQPGIEWHEPAQC